MPIRRIYFIPLSLMLIAAVPPNEKDGEADLLVQAAMRQGRESICREEYAQAVRVLEAHLSRIDGNRAYLQLLEEAYRGYVKQLSARGETELANKYHQKLAILDDGAKLATSVRPAEIDRRPDALLATAAESGPAAAGDEVLAEAGRHFLAKRYGQAEAVYARAYHLKPDMPQADRERWAYATLFRVAEALNGRQTIAYSELIQQVQFALQLAPRFKFGEELLHVLHERARVAGRPATEEVNHLPQPLGGWKVSESANFRIFHQDSSLAERVASAAERARAATIILWTGEDPPAAWRSRCDIYLHAGAQAYARSTGAPAESPGHSTIDFDSGQAVARRIDLRIDEPRMLTGVLPHEITHCALADRFGRKPIPRWADEGLAMLSEPPEHLRRLAAGLAEPSMERMFTIAQLMTLEQYPERRKLDIFYVQSALLVLYLSELKGTTAFGRFLADAERSGFEKALGKHYQIKSFDELQARWEKYAAAILNGRTELKTYARE